jgi:hypothetical protein
MAAANGLGKKRPWAPSPPPFQIKSLASNPFVPRACQCCIDLEHHLLTSEPVALDPSPPPSPSQITMDSAVKRARTELAPSPRQEDFNFLDMGDKSPLMQPMFPDLESMGILCPPSPSTSKGKGHAFPLPVNPFARKKGSEMPAGKAPVVTRPANPFARKKESEMPEDNANSSAHAASSSKKGREIPKKKPGLSAKRPDHPAEFSSEPTKRKTGESSATLSLICSDLLLASVYRRSWSHCLPNNVKPPVSGCFIPTPTICCTY